MRACKFSIFSQFMRQKVHCQTFHLAKFESLHSQPLNLCSASLSASELSCLPLCSLFDLVHSWKLLPPSLTHSCVFEAGEHPHTHTTRDPGSWLVLNPWQGALSLNIKDRHLRACRHDSHPGLSDSQQATEQPTHWMWQGLPEDADQTLSRLRCGQNLAVFVTQLCEHVKIPAVY